MIANSDCSEHVQGAKVAVEVTSKFSYGWLQSEKVPQLASVIEHAILPSPKSRITEENLWKLIDDTT